MPFRQFYQNSETHRFSPLLNSIQKAGSSSGRYSRQKKQNNLYKQFRTAQLHIQNSLYQFFSGAERTPCRKGMLCSLTVEAAAALPVFLAAMLVLMFPMKVIDASSEAQVKLEQAAEYAAVAEGAHMTMKRSATAVEENLKEKSAASGTNSSTSDSGTSGSGTSAAAPIPAGTGESGSAGNENEGSTADAENEEELTPSELLSSAESLAIPAWILAQFDENVFKIPAITTLHTPTAEEPYTKIKVLCVIKFPFTEILGSRLKSIRMVAYRRAWVGRKGGAGREWLSSTESAGTETKAEEEDSEIVYVARNATKSLKYHTSLSCYYISNEMHTVSVSAIGTERNKEGGKYHACPSCKPAQSGEVYIFDHGDAYHASKDCKANRSYAVEMKKSEAIGKGYTQCSNCARRF